jgi:O-acetyl-ADP-ribose deacetylase (regulator of RNase III)
VIQYVTGDATDPQGAGIKVIAHIVNDEGKWGSGFVIALSRRDRTPEQDYRRWARAGAYLDTEFGRRPFALGQTQYSLIKSDPGVYVANMVAQRGVRHDLSAPRAVQYGALKNCLDQLAEFCLLYQPRTSVPSVHMPRIGCGLGGGSWDEVEPIIQSTLITRDIPVTVYDL